MINIDPPNNNENIKSWAAELIDQINYQVSQLEARIEELEKKEGEKE